MCPISQSRYVDITSSVGGNGGVALRDLHMRMISENPLIPSGEVLTFSGQGALNDVEEYFGPASPEYLRAISYFSFISKNGTAPQTLDYYFWNSDAATGSLIFGIQAPYALSTFTGISTGALDLTLGGSSATLTGINLTSDASLAAVAATIQAAIRAHSAGGAAWTAATVAYVAAPTQGGEPQFTLTSGATGTDVVAIAAAGSGVDLAPLIGWVTGAIFSDGTAAQTEVQMLTEMVQNDNNFGTFIFIPTLSNTDVENVAAWNSGQNNLYRYSVPCTSSNASVLSAALLAIANCDLTLSPISTEYPEQIPGTVEAATDYTQRNAVNNYMYQTNFPFTPSVTNDSDANTYDALRINYYGQTQNAGQLINFYQRGVMMGGTNVPQFQGIYANEQWFKSAMFTALMDLLLAFAEIVAGSSGRGIILAQIQSIINQAIFNGTISVGKTLTQTNRLFITQQTGDPQAWQQVQNQGYWVDCVIEPYVNSTNNLTEYKAVYTLIYSKADAVNLIQGNDILI